eukprot:gene17749-biopygen13264
MRFRDPSYRLLPSLPLRSVGTGWLIAPALEHRGFIRIPWVLVFASIALMGKPACRFRDSHRKLRPAPRPGADAERGLVEARHALYVVPLLLIERPHPRRAPPPPPRVIGGSPLPMRARAQKARPAHRAAVIYVAMRHRGAAKYHAGMEGRGTAPQPSARSMFSERWLVSCARAIVWVAAVSLPCRCRVAAVSLPCRCCDNTTPNHGDFDPRLSVGHPRARAPRQGCGSSAALLPEILELTMKAHGGWSAWDDLDTHPPLRSAQRNGYGLQLPEAVAVVRRGRACLESDHAARCGRAALRARSPHRRYRAHRTEQNLQRRTAPQCRGAAGCGNSASDLKPGAALAGRV